MADSFILFGGTFDPIHKGHLLVAHNALRELKSEKVIFVPAKNPRWKVPLESEHRLNMLRLGLEGEKKVEISTIELESKAPVSYSVSTVEQFRRAFPNSNIYFLMGFDQLDRLDEWHDVHKLATMCQIVAYARPGFPKNHEAVKKYNVKVIEYAELINLSSTDIRELRSLMTKKTVIDYIMGHDLYFTKTVQGYYDAHRYRHAVSVANLCYEMALANHVEPTKAYQAGYMHDIGKLLAHDEEAPRLMHRYFPKYVDFPKWAWHQFLGEMIAKYYFGIQEKRVLDAIRYHTTGAPRMGKYGKIVYAADKLDPLRGWDSKRLIEECKEDIDVGFSAVLENNMKFLKHQKHLEEDDVLTKGCLEKYLPLEEKKKQRKKGRI